MLIMRSRHLVQAEHANNAVFAENTSNTSNKLISFSVLMTPTQIGFDDVINLEPNNS
jgi:hypothetical protein